MFSSGYEPTKHLEAGVSLTKLHSISAMPQHQHVSFEEIRMMDYAASDGFFGSKFAALGAKLCVEPNQKLTPHCYGSLFKKALCHRLGPVGAQKIDSLPVQPVTMIKDLVESVVQRPTVNLFLNGEMNVKVVIEGGPEVNVNIQTPSKLAKKWNPDDRHEKAEGSRKEPNERIHRREGRTSKKKADESSSHKASKTKY